MNSRKIDFYIKHLPMDKRLTIFQLMEKINSARVKKLLEKPAAELSGLPKHGIYR